MRSLVAVWIKNPIFRKEMRIGLRERRFVWIQMIYLGLACLVTVFSLRNLDEQNGFYALTMEGEQLKGLLILLQLAALLLVTPALASGAIASERERNSLDLLVVGGASPGQIVAGKLLHCALIAGLLLLAGLPLEVLSLTLGGSSFRGIFVTYFVLGWLTLLLLLFSLMISAREKRSGYAATQSYAGLAVLLFGLVFTLNSLDGSGGLLQFWWDRPGYGYSLLGFNCLYLSLLLFLKTVNHLSPQARYARLMGLVFAVWYLTVSAALSWQMSYRPIDEQGDFWASWILLNLVFLGCFINPPAYNSRRQQSEFARYPGSRWFVWALLLSLGLGVVASASWWAGLTRVTLISLVGLGVYLVLTNLVITRSLGQLAGKRAPFRLVYVLWLAGMCALSSAGLLLAAGKPLAPLWSGVFLSPVYSALSLTQVSNSGVPLYCDLGAEVPLAIPCLIFYGGVALAVSLLAWSKGRTAA